MTGKRRPTWTSRWRVLGLALLVMAATVVATLGARIVMHGLQDEVGNPGSGSSPTVPEAWTDGAVTQADGLLPEGVSLDDHRYPGVANLDPQLTAALRAAAADARPDGVRFVINSGWRSPDYQAQLLRDAVATHGSSQAAAQWVATPETSEHVTGNAVDLGDATARAWLTEHGANYGLCRIYRNEPWHYELRPQAIGHSCPPMYANPAQDPRTQTQTQTQTN